jgi:hypothetical protein
LHTGASVPFFFHNWPSQLNPSPIYRTRWPSGFDLIGGSSSPHYWGRRELALRAENFCVYLFDLHPSTATMNAAPRGILTFIPLSECKIKLFSLHLVYGIIPTRQCGRFLSPRVVAFPQKTFLSYCKTTRKQWISPRVSSAHAYKLFAEWRFHFLSLGSRKPHPPALSSLFRPLRHSMNHHFFVSRNYVTPRALTEDL